VQAKARAAALRDEARNQEHWLKGSTLLVAQLREEEAEDLEREEGAPAPAPAARPSAKLSKRLRRKVARRWHQRLASFSWRLQPRYSRVDVMVREDIGVTRQAFQHDPRAQLSPASQPPAAVTRPLHSINL
jgi:hypothetical protein